MSRILQAILAAGLAARLSARVYTEAGALKFEGTSHKRETFELWIHSVLLSISYIFHESFL